MTKIAINVRSQKEWNELMETMTNFWKKNLSRIFPEDPKGPFLVSISSRHFGAVLNAVKEKGKEGTPEEIESEIIKLIQKDWGRLREVGIIRILRGLLRAGKRTSAYYYDALGKDILRAEPKIISTAL